MFLSITIILGLGCLATGLFIHYKSNDEFDVDEVYISSLDEEVASDAYRSIYEETDTIDEVALLEDIFKDDNSKKDLMSFTQISQRKEKQIPIVGLPDKSLFHIH